MPKKIHVTFTGMNKLKNYFPTRPFSVNFLAML